MLQRPRTSALTGAAGCLLLLALLGAAVRLEPSWLEWLDLRTRPREDYAVDDATALRLLRVVEDAFGTIAMTVYTVLLAGAMLVRRHRRAAILVLGVMLGVSVLTTALKVVVGRERPDWQHPGDLLDSESFPSGHASSAAALAGLVVVLAAMLVRRSGVRRLLTSAVVLAALVVGLDRLLLGRHYPSDLLGGYLLGVGVLLLGLALYSPLPRSHAAGIDPLPQAVPSERRLAVVANPSKVEDLDAFQALVRRMALEAGWREPRWWFTTPEDSGTGQAESAAVAGADLVIVCGGDGTVREVCAELAGTGVPVGIVPAGTGNLLARNLDLPLYMRAAIDIALTGQDRAIDLVAVRGDVSVPGDADDGDDDREPETFDTTFLVMAGMGFDAAIMEGVNEDIKRRVGWLAYVWAALRTLMYPAARLEISVDGGEWTHHRARTVVVGNVGHLQAGMPLLPDAAIDDGSLDVVLLHPQRFVSWIPLAVRVLARRRRTDDTVNRMTGRTVSIRASAPTPRQLDGDSIGPGRELHAECLPGRLLVRVPR